MHVLNDQHPYYVYDIMHTIWLTLSNKLPKSPTWYDTGVENPQYSIALDLVDAIHKTDHLNHQYDKLFT